jgi:hypothetical protein
MFSLNGFTQTHNLYFKVRELSHGTGANIQNAKVDIDNGSFTGFTDANGVAHILDVTDGTHRIQVSKPGYIQFLQDDYTLSSNQTFYASIINKTRVGPWGTDNFNVSWWRQTYVEPIPRNKNPFRWAQIAPINNRISSTPAFTYADSVNIVNAINEIESKTGYDLIKLVPNSASPDTTYSMYTHSSNGSSISSLSGIIYKGYSGFSVSTPTKRVIHEIVHQFGMWPIGNLMYVSVMEPDVATMADMQVWDADNIAVTFDQHYAKQRGEQDFFLGNMMEYVTPTVPDLTSITLPLNNSTVVEKEVRFNWNNVAGTDRYHLEIATDNAFANIIKDLFIYRNDTLITLANDVQYFTRVRQENIVGQSDWSEAISFTTDIITGIEDRLNTKVKIWPNPFNDFIRISGTKNLSSKIKLDFYSNEGKLLKSISSEFDKEVNISDLKAGIYILRIYYPGNSVQPESHKIIKK